MSQLKEDEWPDDREPTTIEQEVAADPINGPKDPERRIYQPGEGPDGGLPSTPERNG